MVPSVVCGLGNLRCLGFGVGSEENRTMLVTEYIYKRCFRSAFFLIFILMHMTVLVLTEAHAATDNMTPRQQEILQTVLSVEGFISEEIHTEFWSSLPAEMRNDTALRKAFVRLIDRTVAGGVIFQRETWASAQASIIAQRVVKTPGYAVAVEGVLSVSSLPEYREPAQKGVDKAERMIKAAASGKAYQTSRGPIYLTPELVTQVLNGLNGSMARFRRLTNPVWEMSVVERKYPGAHVAILSAVPFAVDVQNITTANKKTTKLISLSNRLNETDYVGISFAELGGFWADPQGAVIRTAKATLKGMGTQKSRVFSSQWRGLLSATGSAQAQTSEGSIYASARVVEVREHTGMLTFIAVSGKSKIDADVLLAELEQSTQLLR